MKPNEYMNISEFAKISGISRRTLIFYDEIGLFTPAVIGDNAYRYYTLQQCSTLDTINILKNVGMPLKEIKDFMETRTPEKSVELFTKQEHKLIAEIEKLTHDLENLQTRIWRTKQAATIRLGHLTLENCTTEYYQVSEKLKNTEDDNLMKVYFDFFSTLNERRLNAGKSLGAVLYTDNLWFDESTPYEYQIVQQVSKETGSKFMDNGILEKAAGYYLTEFRSGAIGQSGMITDNMKKYILDNKLQTTGVIWEFWWQDETVTRDVREHIYQTSVQLEINNNSNSALEE